MPDKEKPTMWNGGTTFAEEEQTNYNKMIRESEILCRGRGSLILRRDNVSRILD